MSLISIGTLLKVTDAVYDGDFSEISSENLRSVERMLASEAADSKNTARELAAIRRELAAREQ